MMDTNRIIIQCEVEFEKPLTEVRVVEIGHKLIDDIFNNCDGHTEIHTQSWQVLVTKPDAKYLLEGERGKL